MTCAWVIPGSMVVTCASPRPAKSAVASAATTTRRFMCSPDLNTDTSKHRFEDTQSVVGAEEFVHRTFGVRHHAEHIAGLVHDAGNGAHRTIGTPVLLGVAWTADVPEDDAPVALEAVERLLVRRVASVAV